MRRTFLKFHLYSGLICFWYLIILGTSSLNFNHHFSFMEKRGEAETWSKTVRLVNSFQDDGVLSETLRDSLSLIGWPLPWETYHDSTGVFHFTVQHPGKKYVIAYSFDDQVAHVEETPKGFWPIFNAMHGVGAIPNSGFMRLWSGYTTATVILVIFSALTGIYVWYRGNRDKKPGFYTLVASLLISLAWMLEMYLNG